MKHLSQVVPGRNNILRGTAYRTVKAWIIFSTKYTNDHGLAEQSPILSSIRVLKTLRITLTSCRDLKSFPSGVLDVGYVYD